MSLFREIFQGPPPEDVDLFDVIKVERAAPELDQQNVVNETVHKQLNKRQNWIYQRDGVQPPVTEAESEEMSRRLQESLEEVRDTITFMEETQAEIDQHVQLFAPDFELNLKTTKNRKLKRALRKLFGRDMDVIKWSEFKALLEAKSRMEREALEEYEQDIKGISL